MKFPDLPQAPGRKDTHALFKVARVQSVWIVVVAFPMLFAIHGWKETSDLFQVAVHLARIVVGGISHLLSLVQIFVVGESLDTRAPVFWHVCLGDAS